MTGWTQELLFPLSSGQAQRRRCDALAKLFARQLRPPAFEACAALHQSRALLVDVWLNAIAGAGFAGAVGLQQVDPHVGVVNRSQYVLQLLEQGDSGSRGLPQKILERLERVAEPL